MDAHYLRKALKLTEAGRIRVPDFGFDTTYFFGR